MVDKLGMGIFSVFVLVAITGWLVAADAQTRDFGRMPKPESELISLTEMDKALEEADVVSVDRFWQIYGEAVGAQLLIEGLGGHSVDYRALATKARTAALQSWYLGEHYPGE